MNEKIKEILDTICVNGMNKEILNKELPLEQRKEAFIEGGVIFCYNLLRRGVTEESIKRAKEGAMADELVSEFGEGAKLLVCDDIKNLFKNKFTMVDIGAVRGACMGLFEETYKKTAENPETWVYIDKYADEHICEDIETQIKGSVTTSPQDVVDEVAALAETTVSEIHIPTEEEIHERLDRLSQQTTSSYSSGGGSSSGGISALGWVGIAAVGAAALYGGYHLWNSDETEMTIEFDNDEAF